MLRIISSKRAGDHTDIGTLAAGKGGEWIAEGLVVRERAGACKGNLPELLFMKKSPVRRPGTEMKTL